MNDMNKNLEEVRSSYRSVRSIKGLRLKREARINRVHVLMDIYKCEDKALAKATLLEQRVKKVLSQFQLEPKVETFYQFKPFGVTAIVFAKELQFTIHTWPEYKSAAIDLYCFNSRKMATDICDSLKAMFKPGEYEMKVRKR